ncbi:Glutamine-dependent NAD(+) synthetase [Phycisphaerae bacterium RAS1]|nr:Glutamine-dependent NAD(+) synthetase [Phycisphaerae bacterium RAS1]
MKLALIQTNPTIGDIAGNTARIIERLADAERAGAELAVFPEQAIIGYPAKDLLLRREVIQANQAALARIAAACTRIAAIVGFAEPTDRPFGRPLYNAAALLSKGQIAAVRRKRLLPTYDVFDEARYFEPAGPQQPVEFRGVRLGLTICEDMWSQEELYARPLYDCDPIRDVAAAGAETIINISASPYFIDKQPLRIELMAAHAKRSGVPIIFVNQVGGNDELIFDGANCAIDRRGATIAQARAFDEDLLLVESDAADVRPARIEPIPAGVAGVHDALILGLRDYLRKCGFTSAVMGLSGGIDSAVVAALAAAALPPENVLGVAMPSRFSSDHSVADARALAVNLGIRFSQIPIEPVHRAYEQTMAEAFAGRAADVTEENIQARVRGGILMALSNKFGSLLLTTGNKSELAVGYCTLYGDMCGGLAVISDVPKTMVYSLARHINARAGRDVIPHGSLSKPPSAELRPNQTDQDSLPPYEVLDEILRRYEEQLQSVDEMVAAGADRAAVERVVRLIQSSEYKRQQAAPGLKVTSRAFGFGRRMPIAVRWPR